tara:strand:- start:2320 stop:3363 length:1044 start_codon:yes stop_codon:yes gene_type:complete
MLQMAAVLFGGLLLVPSSFADPYSLVDEPNSGSWVLGTPGAESETPLSRLSYGLADSIAQVSNGNEVGAVVALGKGAVDFWLPQIGDDLPEWLKHMEFEWGVNENNTPEYSILGVFPLYESEDLQDTVFTQLSQRRYRYLGVDRDVTNAGLGYRRLFFDNQVLVGVNGFFDYGWKYNHQRVSAGAEAKWAGLDFSTNYYLRASNRHSAGGSSSEEVLDGHDIRLAAQIPYLPWARIHGRRYWWSTNRSAEDIKGWEMGMEMDLHQNLQLEAGLVSDNFIEDGNNNEGYIKLRFAMALNRPVAASSEWISENPWLMRDMSEYRLDKVQRENKIIVERVSSGVVITRGS